MGSGHEGPEGLGYKDFEWGQVMKALRSPWPELPVRTAWIEAQDVLQMRTAGPERSMYPHPNGTCRYIEGPPPWLDLRSSEQEGAEPYSRQFRDLVAYPSFTRIGVLGAVVAPTDCKTSYLVAAAAAREVTEGRVQSALVPVNCVGLSPPGVPRLEDK